MVLVGSETICDRWKTDMVEIMLEEEEEEDSRLMLKSPSNTAFFSLAGSRDARKCCKSDKE